MNKTIQLTRKKRFFSFKSIDTLFFFFASASENRSTAASVRIGCLLSFELYDSVHPSILCFLRNGYVNNNFVTLLKCFSQIALMFILLTSFLEYCFAILVFEFDSEVSFCSCSTMRSMAEELQRKCMNPGSFMSLIYWNPITNWVSHLFSHMTCSMISCKFLKILEDSFVRFVSSRHWSSWVLFTF
ncbi:hypothetical protein NC652_017216 [Populus alba x Populus x berolinensis]|nr:hypothetical protein NC652_017216 [Populus alba x Populus x berolinensis]